MLAALHIPEKTVTLPVLTVSALKVLLYYDLFRYPLTASEILYHCRHQGCTESQLHNSLSALISDGKIFHHDGYYLLKNEPHLIERRIKGNALAEKMKQKAAKKSELIARFPYVRGICISGSLSKNYCDETTDIDFFIITAPGRLWVCRSLLILYKKLFLLNSKKYFCINYFIDSENLSIPDKNIFTATEIITLIPSYNHPLYSDFFRANDWITDYYPNATMAQCNTSLSKESIIKRTLEKLLDTQLGEWLDRYFYKTTINHWKKKFKGMDEAAFELNMRSRKDVSKHHPQGFQFRVLKMYDENCRAFEAKHGIPLLS